MDPKDELKTRIKQIIVKQLKLEIDPASIRDDAPLFGDAANGLGSTRSTRSSWCSAWRRSSGSRCRREVGVKAFASVDALHDFIRQKNAA